MFKKLTKFMFVAAFVAATVSCTESEIVTISGFETALQEQEVFADGAEFSFKFNASKAWTAESKDPWMTIEPSNGPAGDSEITVNVPPNTTGADRTSSITIVAGEKGIPVVVNVSQKALTGDGLAPLVIKYEVSNVANATDPTVNTLGEALINKFGEDYATKVDSIRVIGSMNSADFISLITFKVIDLREVDVVGSIIVHPAQPPTEDAIPFAAFIAGGTVMPNDSLTTIYLPNEVKEIGAMSFAKCSELVDIRMPNELIKISANAFQASAKLKNIISWGKVEDIQDGAFAQCLALESVELPETVKIIGSDIFYECAALTKVVIPESIESIGDNAFSLCVSLEELVLPDHLVYNDCVQLIQKCRELKSFTIGANTTVIPFLFAFSSGLETLDIPATITAFAAYPFADCKDMTQITVNWTEKGDIPEVKPLATLDDHDVSFQWETDEIVGTFSQQFGVDVDNDNYIIVPKGTMAIYNEVVGWNSYKLKEAN